jgi:hypothetical protein
MKLSIITINFNYAEGLQKNIKSVIPQTFSDFGCAIGGSSYFIKLFIHSQMNGMLTSNIIDNKILDGLYNLTKYIPEYGAEIFVYCQMKFFSL